MRWLRYLGFTACLLLPLLAVGQDEKWLPISPQEQQLKEVPGNPSAPAIQLFYSQYADHATPENEAEFIYRRIKILNEKGREQADVKVALCLDCKLQHLKAHTIHPDGKVIEMEDKAFDTTIIKGRGFKQMGKSFTLPDVTVGSIIEYRYKIDYPPNELPYTEWHVQGDLYALKEVFRFRAYTGQLLHVQGGTGVSASFMLPPGVKPQRKGEGWEMQVENVPPFEPEAYMPPEDQYIYRVSFRYGGREMQDVEHFWQDFGIKTNIALESFIGNSREIKDAAAQIVAGEADPEKQLRKLYARAQQIRNLTYERGRTEEELKKENLRPNENAQDVLNHGYGSRDDVTKLFVALARAAGFESTLVKATNRGNARFDKNVLSTYQMDTEVAAVKLKGNEIYLDPGTRFCPYGLLRWIRTSTEGLRVDKKGGTFVMLPPEDQSKAVTQRAAVVTLAPDGSVKGQITVQYTGIMALEHRLQANETDEAGRAKALEDEIRGRLPQGAIVKFNDAKNWEGSEEPLEAHFSVEVPVYAAVAGKRLLPPVYLFQTRELGAFKLAQRKFPVYFPFAFAEIDTVRINLPPGYSVETVPQQQSAGLPYAVYQNLSQSDGTQIYTQRRLLMNGIFFPVDKYPELKGFFNKVQAGDEQQAVLQGGVASAQKSN